MGSDDICIFRDSIRFNLYQHTYEKDRFNAGAFFLWLSYNHRPEQARKPTKERYREGDQKALQSTFGKDRKARMRLQLQQIKKHKNQLKEVDSVQKKLDKETRKSN